MRTIDFQKHLENSRDIAFPKRKLKFKEKPLNNTWMTKGLQNHKKPIKQRNEEYKHYKSLFEAANLKSFAILN